MPSGEYSGAYVDPRENSQSAGPNVAKVAGRIGGWPVTHCLTQPMPQSGTWLESRLPGLAPAWLGCIHRT